LAEPVPRRPSTPLEHDLPRPRGKIGQTLNTINFRSGTGVIACSTVAYSIVVGSGRNVRLLALAVIITCGQTILIPTRVTKSALRVRSRQAGGMSHALSAGGQ
jgi:hypothetical protein